MCLSLSVSCPVKGQLYLRCSQCQGTCRHPVVPCPRTPCIPGCACPPGQVIDTEANECVHPDQCPFDCTSVVSQLHKNTLHECMHMHVHVQTITCS